MACRAAVFATSVAVANKVSALVPCSSRRSWSSMLPVLHRRRSLQGGIGRVSGRRPAGSSNSALPRASFPEKEPAETSKQVEEFLTLLKVKWESAENKTNVAIYGGGGLVFLWLSSSIVGAINTVPLVPKIMELIGLGYTVWFVYRYLLFKSNRKELALEIEELKSKITGSADDITN